MSAVLDLPLRAGDWRIDLRRSTVGFSVRHLGVSTVHGRFASFGGQVAAGEGGVRVTGHVDAASVDTDNAIRDARLRHEFFRSDEHPEITFRSEDVASDDQGAVFLTGDLTIRGVTRPITLAAITSEGAGDLLRLHAESEISRSSFGLDWDALREAGRLLVGDRVRITLDVVLRRVP